MLRLPGLTIAWRTPARTHSSTKVAQKVTAVSEAVVMASIVEFVKVEIWSDVVCPWCYIGKRRFETALARLGDKGIIEPIEVRYRSYQLDPRAPTTQVTPVLDAYAKKFGGRERAEQILAHLTAVAAADGLEFHFDIAKRANTVLAHRALHWVHDVHGAPAQAAAKEHMLEAYFTLGLDISDEDVVASQCAKAGLDVAPLSGWLKDGGGLDAVAADMQAAADREITAVPSYVIDDKFLIPGAQDASLFEQVLGKMLSR